MSASSITRYVRPIEEVRDDLVARGRVPSHPWPPYVQADEVESIFTNIHSLDRDEWARAFCAVAAPYEERAHAAEAAGDAPAARDSYRRAYAYYRMGATRPPTHPANAWPTTGLSPRSSGPRGTSTRPSSGS